MGSDLETKIKNAEEKVVKRRGRRVNVGVMALSGEKHWGCCQFSLGECAAEINDKEIWLYDKHDHRNKFLIDYRNLKDIQINKDERLWITYIYEDLHITLIA